MPINIPDKIDFTEFCEITKGLRYPEDRDLGMLAIKAYQNYLDSRPDGWGIGDGESDPLICGGD